jgi:hypothetical protein
MKRKLDGEQSSEVLNKRGNNIVELDNNEISALLNENSRKLIEWSEMINVAGFLIINNLQFSKLTEQNELLTKVKLMWLAI